MASVRLACFAKRQVVRTFKGTSCMHIAPASATNLEPFWGLCSWRGCHSDSQANNGFGIHHRVYDDLLEHKGVGSLRLLGEELFIVPASRSEFGFLSSEVDEKSLRDYLTKECGFKSIDIPKINIVKELPSDDQSHCPFMLQSVLDSLFRVLDSDANGTISMEEFKSFCHKHDLFSNDEYGLRSAFQAADRQTLRGFGGQELDVSEFKELLLTAGFVESRVGQEAVSGGAYLIDKHIVDVVLKHWFARYDSDGDGSIDFKEYCRLVADYQLPYAVSRHGFNKLDKNGDGVIDMLEFKMLLMDAKILATGEAISRKDDEEGLRKTWRAIENTQVFLPSLRVFSSATELPPQDASAIRFVCISDTHSHHHDLTDKIPAGDVLLHAGDFSMCGEMQELANFGAWLKDLPFAMKILIAGNHDLTLDVDYELNDHPSVVDEARALLLKSCGDSTVLLQDEVINFKDIRIYGSPWQPAFGSWAFNLPRGEHLARKWRNIPSDVDILLVHGPPMGRGDSIANRHVGCANLLHEIQNRVRPTFCVAGHIHSPGSSFDGLTHYVNASSCDEDYECVHPPQVFDILKP